MSKQQHHDALLPGYHGPFFPPSVDHLRETIDANDSCNGEWLGAVARTVNGHISRDNATTSDDYSWFWGLHFGPPNAEVVVLVPWAQDWGKKDDTQADRSIAVYTRGVDEATADRVLQEYIIAAMQPRGVDWYNRGMSAKVLEG